MKKNSFIIFCFLLGQCYNYSFAQESTAFYKKAQQLLGDFNAFHILPAENTEVVSREMVELFFTDIDPDGSVLKQNDLNYLRKYSGAFLEELTSGKDNFIEKAIQVYKRALISSDSILDVIAAKPLNFKEKDSVSFFVSNQKPVYSDNLNHQAKRTLKHVKLLCLRKAYAADTIALSEEQFHNKANTYAKNSIARLKKELKEKLNSYEKTCASSLLNAMAKRFDPHSDYFTFEQKNNFNRSLSAHIESFGFMLDENDNDEIEIAYMNPGGSAWMSNEISEGDLFVSMMLGNKKYTPEEGELEQLQELIENTAEKIMDLELKKKSGLLKTVRLIKRKTESDENNVKGYILKGNGKNMGYIALPSFYTEMDDPGQPGCANDVAKEILKLENDTISGLIIDLRSNGGGSMLEAMNLAGIFIDEGPLFIYKEKGRKPTLMKDMNRGTVFKKPIIVMINEFSASASELFSNVVKDYNLGLVVGQPSYGKGTAQVVLPLDTNLLHRKHLPDNATSDFIKVTNGRFYRLNCSSHQGAGVIPDIAFPSARGMYSWYRESAMPYYLRPDSVQKKVVYTPKASLPLEQLLEQSQKRQTLSPDFKNFRSKADSLVQFMSMPQRIPLNQKGFSSYSKKMEHFSEMAEQASAARQNTIKARNNTFDKKLYEINPDLKAFNLEVIQSINEDIFINETFQILNDLINTQQK